MRTATNSCCWVLFLVSWAVLSCYVLHLRIPKPMWQQTQPVGQVIKDCDWTGGEIIFFFPSRCCRNHALSYEIIAHFGQPLLSSIWSEKARPALSNHPVLPCEPQLSHILKANLLMAGSERGPKISPCPKMSLWFWDVQVFSSCYGGNSREGGFRNNILDCCWHSAPLLCPPSLWINFLAGPAVQFGKKAAAIVRNAVHKKKWENLWG